MPFEIDNNLFVRFEDDGTEVVTIPDGITHIGEYAFAGTDVVKVILPSGLKKIEQYAFRSCSMLREVVFPDTLKEIARFAFWDCESLERICLPESVDIIGNAVFRDCYMLKDLKLPSKMQSIGSSAFSNCASIEKITVPDGIEIIKQRAFYGCLALKEVTLPDTVSEIEEYAFESCRILDSLKLPEKVKYIGRHAFDTCRSLKNIYVPQTVESIGSSAFINTALLNDFPSDFVTVGNGILVQYKGKDTDVVVPDGIKMIGERAFSYNKNIKSIKFPDGLKAICEYAFESCEALTSVELPDSVEILGGYAFTGCFSLSKARLSPNLSSVGSDIFYDTTLLNDHTDDIFIQDEKYLIKYKGNETEPVIPQNITYICDKAFAGCETLQKVIIPDGVEFIGCNAFEWCKELQCAKIPQSVKVIGDNAFRHCESINAEIACGNKHIGENAFFKNARITLISDNINCTVTLQNDLVAPNGENEALLAKFISKPSADPFCEMTEDSYKIPIAMAFCGTIEKCAEYLQKNALSALRFIIDENNTDMLGKLLSLKYLGKDDTDYGIEYALKHSRLELQMQLMHFKHDNWGDSGENDLDEKFKL